MSIIIIPAGSKFVATNLNCYTEMTVFYFFCRMINLNAGRVAYYCKLQDIETIHYNPGIYINKLLFFVFLPAFDHVPLLELHIMNEDSDG